MATEEQIETEWDGTRFPREKNTGVIMGLDGIQVTFIGLGLVFSVALVFALGFPLGLFLGFFNLVVTAAIGIPRFWGKSIITWVVHGLERVFRGTKGQLRFHRELPVADLHVDREEREARVVAWRDKYDRIDPGEGYRLNLPGEAGELTIYELPGGPGFVFDPRTREGTVVAKLVTRRAFDLESDEAQVDRTRGFRDSISALAGVPGVSRVQLSDQTTMLSGSRVKQWYDQKRAAAPTVLDEETGEKLPLSGENINPFLHASYVDLIENAQDQPVHEMWLSVVFDAKKLERRALAAGGGLRGFMEVVVGTMGNIESLVPASGVVITGWHTPRSMAALSRTAFDPDATLEISDREGDWSGVAPEEAGPMGMEVAPGHLYSDGWYHRTYTISEWPQAQANLGFMEKFIFSGEFRHTVSVILRPKEIRGALRKTQNRKADWETADKFRRKLDRPESLEHKREIEDIEQEELDLMAGHAAVDIAALITVSGATPEELESNSADMTTKAAEANCELRPAQLQQDAAFIAGALPFGRAVLTR